MDGDHTDDLKAVRKDYWFKIKQWHTASHEGMPNGNGGFEEYEAEARAEAHRYGRGLGFTTEEVDEALGIDPDAA